MIKRSSHGEARHGDAGRPTSEAARDRAEAGEIYRDGKLDTTFLWENAAELTYSSTTACITQASEQRRRTERVAFRLANGYLL